MAGRGPAPKDPNRRARRNRDPIPLHVVRAEPMPQPKLPPLAILVGEGVYHEVEWPERTVQWWAMWKDSPLSAQFTSTDWSELIDTARLHALFWLGDTKVAAELRLRVAKFGATPEDRARLRITFALADEAEAKKPSRPTARERFGGLSAVPSSAKKAAAKKAPVARRRTA